MFQIGSFFNAALSGFPEGLISLILTAIIVVVSSYMFAPSMHIVYDKDMSISALVRAIHAATEATGKRFVVGVTGGGSTALSHLMSQFGASNTILEFNCTYACESTQEYVKHSIKSFASIETAKELATASLNRSIALLTTQCTDLACLTKLNNAVGIGATASLASKAWKRGEHRIFVALTKNNKELTSTITFSLNMFKGVEGSPFRTREEEDDLCGKLIVCIVAYECGLLNTVSLREFMQANGLDEKDTLVMEISAKNSLEDLIAGNIENVLCIPADGDMYMIANVPLHLLGKYTEQKSKIVALPGSFNPLHDGHVAALHAGIALCDSSQGMYELSVFNVDKPPLAIADLITRLTHFLGQSIPVFLTKTPRFIDKARAYPGMSYVVGVDTVIRLIDPMYTGGSKDLMKHSLKEMTDMGTEFIVIPRTFRAAKMSPNLLEDEGIDCKEDDVLTYSMIRMFVPHELHGSFKEIVENKYTTMSSSAIRSATT